MKVSPLIEREILNYKRTIFMAVAVLLTPIIYLFIFGYTISGSVDVRYHGVAYLNYILPGILVVAVLYSSLVAGMNVFMEETSHTTLEFMSMPVRKGAVPLVKIVVTSLFTSIDVIVLSIVAWLTVNRGILIDPYIELLLFASTFLLSVAFTSFSIGIFSFFTQEKGFNAVASMITVPAVFMSTVYYPLSLMAPPIMVIAEINPVSFGADMFRAIMFNLSVSFTEIAAFACFFTAGILLTLFSWGKHF